MHVQDINKALLFDHVQAQEARCGQVHHVQRYVAKSRMGIDVLYKPSIGYV